MWNGLETQARGHIHLGPVFSFTSEGSKTKESLFHSPPADKRRDHDRRVRRVQRQDVRVLLVNIHTLVMMTPRCSKVVHYNVYVRLLTDEGQYRNSRIRPAQTRSFNSLILEAFKSIHRTEPTQGSLSLFSLARASHTSPQKEVLSPNAMQCQPNPATRNDAHDPEVLVVHPLRNT